MCGATADRGDAANRPTSAGERPIRIKRLHAPDTEDPLINPFSKQDVTVITDSGKPNMEIVTNKGEKVAHYGANGAPYLQLPSNASSACEAATRLRGSDENPQVRLEEAGFEMRLSIPPRDEPPPELRVTR